MKLVSIRKYLRPSTVLSRKSTFSNAFASALAPHDEYDAAQVAEAMRDLGQNPYGDLLCVYCGDRAATWDHVFNRVVKGEFSGHGHRIRNLVPCCRSCNERKGQKPWREFLDLMIPVDKEDRVTRIEKFLSKSEWHPVVTEKQSRPANDKIQRFLAIRSQIFDLMAEADKLAAIIRKG